ncbi:MAG: Gfo/Idh/MocA family oxidoreductase [Ruminococcaceae bacterium]|nr:Gfo/Idh/MocA family oxidoreductase [Oscillospiraceae bacterium]
MKVAVFGVWHVHASDYTKKAMELGEVLGFYEQDDKLAEQFMQKFPIHRFPTAEALLESDAEGVIVCSATSSHTEDMVRIANAGKHIFTEKVLALTSADCDRVAEAVERNGVGFTISLVQKYHAPCLAVKAVAESGELGKLNYLRFRNCHSGSVNDWLPNHFYSQEQCGGGAMIDLGAHGMYLIHWLLGMPASAGSVFGIACSNNAALQRNVDRVEDNAVTTMGYENGTIAINETGFVSRYSPRVLELYGEDGYVRLEGKRVFKCTKATEGALVEVEVGEALPAPVEQFLTGKPLGGCGMEEAKALTKMMELAYAGEIR